MKVSFKLNAAQAANADCAVQHYNNDEAQGQPCYNPDQSLIWDAASQTLTYVGQRHPLWMDAGGEALCLVALGQLPTQYTDYPRKSADTIAAIAAALVVVEYVTTVATMKWWETNPKCRTAQTQNSLGL